MSHLIAYFILIILPPTPGSATRKCRLGEGFPEGFELLRRLNRLYPGADQSLVVLASILGKLPG